MDLKLLTAAMVMVMGFTSCGAATDDRKAEIECIPVKVKGDTNWSLMDRKGRLALRDCVDSLTTVAADGVFAMAKSDGTFSLYRLGGEEADLLEGGFTSIGEIDGELIPASKPGEGVFAMDRKGRRKFAVKPCEGHEPMMFGQAFGDGLLLVCFDDYRHGYCDTEGKLAIAPRAGYNFTGFTKGYAQFTDRSTHRSSVIDRTGRVVWTEDPKREKRSSLQNGIIMRETDDALVLQRPTGETLYTHRKATQSDRMLAWDDDICVLQTRNPKTGKTGTGAIDMKGNVLVDFDYDRIALCDKHLVCTNSAEKTRTIYTRKGEFKIHLTDAGAAVPVEGFGYLALGATDREAAIFSGDGNGGLLNTTELEDASTRREIDTRPGLLRSPTRASADFVDKTLLELLKSENYLRQTYDDTRRVYYTWGRTGFDRIGQRREGELKIGAPATNFACVIDTIESGDLSVLLFDYLMDAGVMRVYGVFDAPVSNNTFNGAPIIEKEPRLEGFTGLMGTFSDTYELGPAMLPMLETELTSSDHGYTAAQRLRAGDKRPYLLLGKGNELLCLTVCRDDDENSDTNWVAFFRTDTAHRAAIEEFVGTMWGSH